MITGGCKYKILAHAQVGPQGGGVVSVFSLRLLCTVSDVTE
jgi:hypothetical protein